MGDRRSSLVGLANQIPHRTYAEEVRRKLRVLIDESPGDNGREAVLAESKDLFLTDLKSLRLLGDTILQHPSIALRQISDNHDIIPRALKDASAARRTATVLEATISLCYFLVTEKGFRESSVGRLINLSADEVDFYVEIGRAFNGEASPELLDHIYSARVRAGSRLDITAENILNPEQKRKSIETIISECSRDTLPRKVVDSASHEYDVPVLDILSTVCIDEETMDAREASMYVMWKELRLSLDEIGSYFLDEKSRGMSYAGVYKCLKETIRIMRGSKAENEVSLQRIELEKRLLDRFPDLPKKGPADTRGYTRIVDAYLQLRLNSHIRYILQKEGLRKEDVIPELARLTGVKELEILSDRRTSINVAIRTATLLILGEFPETSQKDCATYIHRDRSTLTYHLHKIEEAGLYSPRSQEDNGTYKGVGSGGIVNRLMKDRTLRVKDVIPRIAEGLGISEDDMRGRSRRTEAVNGRVMATTLYCGRFELTREVTAALLGGRDQSTVTYYVALSVRNGWFPSGRELHESGV